LNFSLTYKPLCTVNIYHEYFLNDGLMPFDSSESLKEKQLSKYDVREFIDLIPTEETYQYLNNHKIIFKPTETGFKLLVQAEEIVEGSQDYTPKVFIPKNFNLTFLLYVNDFLFENYSTVNAIPNIPFYFSNKKPASENNNFSYIDLEKTTHAVSNFKITETTWEGINKTLSEKEKESLFGVISLNIMGDDVTSYDANNRNLLSKDDKPIIELKTFKIQFTNRKTIWHYKNALNNTLLHSTEPKQLPLVKNGTVDYTFNSKKQPAASPTRLIVEKDTLGNITRTISEIFINESPHFEKPHKQWTAQLH